MRAVVGLGPRPPFYLPFSDKVVVFPLGFDANSAMQFVRLKVFQLWRNCQDRSVLPLAR